MSDEMATAEAPEPARPLLRVVSGDPTPEELAALVAVIASRNAASGGAAPAVERSQWGHPARAVRAPVRHGVNGWRSSVLGR